MGEVLITEEMIKAGVEVYSSPGRYEPYDGVVTRIFMAMFSHASPESAASMRRHLDEIVLRGKHAPYIDDESCKIVRDRAAVAHDEVGHE